MKRLRIYVDTSVFGGAFDDEFKEDSIQLFEDIQSGKYILILSTAILRELANAPYEVKNVLEKIPEIYIEPVEFDQEIEKLRNSYISTGVLGASSLLDAEHIASATIAGADIIVSWNFKHIVHFDKIRGFNAVNLFNGYQQITIHSPKEVVKYEK